MIKINENECIQIKTVIESLEKGDKDKIPNQIIEKINKIASKSNYTFNLDLDLPLEKQISRNSLIFIICIVFKYIAKNQDKDKIEHILVKNKILKEKAETDYTDIFKRIQEEETKESSTDLVLYEKNNSIIELLNKIKEFLLNNFEKLKRKEV